MSQKPASMAGYSPVRSAVVNGGCTSSGQIILSPQPPPVVVAKEEQQLLLLQPEQPFLQPHIPSVVAMERTVVAPGSTTASMDPAVTVPSTHVPSTHVPSVHPQSEHSKTTRLMMQQEQLLLQQQQEQLLLLQQQSIQKQQQQQQEQLLLLQQQEQQSIQQQTETSSQSDDDYNLPPNDEDDYTYMYFADRRHESMPVVQSAKMQQEAEAAALAAAQGQEWRLRDRLKTVSVSLVLCLNIGVDPPDIVKPNPCARMECWIDPFSLPTQKALEAIGRNLQQQYEVWQPRARYRLSLDPSIEETKKLCCSLRRNAKDERILFHYNGHGVPKPTPGGEIWVFNKNYTQYIPVSVYDIQTWLGSPCIFVYDCSSAGNILVAFDKFATQRDSEMLRQHPELVRDSHLHPAGTNTGSTTGSTTNNNNTKNTTIGSTSGTTASNLASADGLASASASASAGNSNSANGLNGSTAGPGLSGIVPPPTYIPLKECIQLAACQPHEILPTSPDLPADLFTCCLTTPIEIALRWFVLQNDLSNKITPSMIMRIPGKLADRRTPLGELNWIFTAITDTIAWSVLSPAMFQKLFRQDLMVAALFRNFLLADRIMRFFKCHPMSSPVLPETYRHPIWDAWDLAADQCLRQMPALLEPDAGVAASTTLPDSKTSTLLSQKKVEYKYSTFFAEQLSAFEVWLRKGAISRKPPQQLPIVLQVLLSQVHRLRALMLLSKFLDLGQWAVQLALSVGIFPYVLRLLQSPASELKPVLVFIWSKILAVDSSCQNDLIKDNGYTYFINILSADNNNMPVISNLSEHRAMCAFILAVFCHNYRFGQQACLKTDLLQALVPHLEDKDPLLRQWACVCLSELWKGYTDAKWAAVGSKIPEQLAMMLNDQVAEVRAAALAAIGTLFGDLEKTPAVLLIENKMAMMVLKCQADASALVRQELVVALSRFAHQYPTKMVHAALELIEDERRRSASTLDEHKLSGYKSRQPTSSGANAGSSLERVHAADLLLKGGPQSSVYTVLWKALLNLAVDPAKNIAQLASQVVDKIHCQLFTSVSIDASLLQTFLPTSSTSLSMGDLSGVTSGNTLPGILSNSSTGLSAISVSNSGLSASVSQVLPMPAMYGPLQPQTHVYYYAQLPHQSTTPPLLGSVLQPSVALDKSGTANSQATNGSGGNTNLNAQSALLPGNHQRQRQLNLHRQRPASMVGMLQTGTATLSPSQQPHLQPSGQAMRRSSSFVTSLRNLAGLMVGSYGANNPDTAVAADFGGGGMASILRSGSTDSNIGNRSGSPLMHSTSTVPPSHRDANGGPVYSGVNRVHPRSSMPIFARMGSSDGRSGDSGTGSRGTVGFNDGAGSALATQFLSRGEDLDDACANPNKVAFNSAFYEWSCAYFSEPQMRVPDVDDPGSIKFIERQWRRERNNKVIQETDALYTYSSAGKFEEHMGSVPNDRPAHLVLFHSYEPLVVSADDQVISIYDWEESTKVNTFSNDNPKGSRITSLQFINEDDATLLLTGSDDGLVRLYRNFNHQNVELVAAWRALSDILPGSRGSGLHCRWQQSSGYLFVGGDSRIIKVWDAEEELCIQELPTKSTSQVTGLSVDPTGIMMLAGFMDGNVKLYDRRLPPHECVVANFAESTSRVLQVAYVGYQHQEFLMGTASGDVLLWDIRQRARTLKINVGIPDVQITAFSIHEHGLLVGCGSNTQNVRVMNLMGETIGAVRYNEGFLQRQTLPVHSLAFHPRRLILAVNTASSMSFFRSDAQNFMSHF